MREGGEMWSRPWRRHDLLHVAPDVWASVLAFHPSLADLPLLRDAPLRIDGEIIFPDGSGVNWRELWNAHQAAGRATVLAKTMESVRLLDVASLACVAGRA